MSAITSAFQILESEMSERPARLRKQGRAQFQDLGDVVTPDEAVACNGESCSFLSRRLRADPKFGRALAGCKNLGKAAAVQQRWAKHRPQDDADEARGLVGLSYGNVSRSFGSIAGPGE
jgi:hypothetical protein